MNPSGPIVGAVVSFASRLRFPVLFWLTAALLVVDLAVPDFVPFVDEILLALATLMLGTMRDRKRNVPDPSGDAREEPQVIDVEPEPDRNS